MPNRPFVIAGAAVAILAPVQGQSPCPTPIHYGSGTAGTGSLVPTIAALGTAALGNPAFAFRVGAVASGAPVLLGLALAPASVPALGIQVLVAAPVLWFDFATPAGTVTFPFPLPGTPSLAGIPLFAQSAVLDPGGPQGFAASDGLQVSLCSASMTDVTLGTAVRLANVKRLGLNIGSHDRWGAAKLLNNQLPNPGFEPGIFGTVWLANPSSTQSQFVARDWNPGNGSHGPGFWDGAEFEIVHGAAAGTSGVVQSFTHTAGNYVFALGSSGSTALADRDVMFTRRTFAGAFGMNGAVGTADANNPYSGAQSLRLAPGNTFAYAMDTSWRDGDQSSHKLLVVEGQWRVRLKARAANTGDQVRVRYRRDGGSPFNPVFLDRTFTLASGWAPLQENATIAAGADQTPEPWPANTYRPALLFEVVVPASNVGPIWIDEVELYRVDEATNPTVFCDRFVERLIACRPGVLRWWDDQLGNSLENMTRSWPERATSGFRPNEAVPGAWNHGVSDFLRLCQHVGAEPWIVMPPTATAADLLGFIEYLAGTSGPFAQRRVNQGQTAPWTNVFDRLHLEWGNELWGTGAPGDPFAGASVNGGVRLGRLADRAFAIAKSSPWYAANAARFDFIIGGQAGYSGRQQEIEASADDHDSTALAPYFGTLNSFASEAEMYGPLFAGPFFQSLHPGGRMLQSRAFLQNGGNGTEMAIYEINYHTTDIIPGLSQTLRNQFVAGASGAIALPLTMLVYMTELGARTQCAFLALGYSHRFDGSGGWPPQQHQFVQVWGMLRDLYHYDVRRPTWLGLELANQAIFGDAIATTQAGDNPTWTQPPLNGIGAPTTVPYVQSFAFRDGNQYGLVLFNLSLTEHHGVRLHVPGVPLPTATMHRLEPANLATCNDTVELVHPVVETITNFHDGYELLLPPHSVRALIWHN